MHRIERSSSPLRASWRRLATQTTNRARRRPTGSGWEMPSPSPSVAACNTRDPTCHGRNLADEHGDDPPARHDGDLARRGLASTAAAPRNAHVPTRTAPLCGTGTGTRARGPGDAAGHRALEQTRGISASAFCDAAASWRPTPSISRPSAVIRSPSSRIACRSRCISCAAPAAAAAGPGLLRDLVRARRASATRSMRASRARCRGRRGCPAGLPSSPMRAPSSPCWLPSSPCWLPSLPCCSPSSRTGFQVISNS